MTSSIWLSMKRMFMTRISDRNTGGSVPGGGGERSLRHEDTRKWPGSLITDISNYSRHTFCFFSDRGSIRENASNTIRDSKLKGSLRPIPWQMWC